MYMEEKKYYMLLWLNCIENLILNSFTLSHYQPVSANKDTNRLMERKAVPINYLSEDSEETLDVN